jgi:hypothetical protein
MEILQKNEKIQEVILAFFDAQKTPKKNRRNVAINGVPMEWFNLLMDTPSAEIDPRFIEKIVGHFVKLGVDIVDFTNDGRPKITYPALPAQKKRINADLSELIRLQTENNQLLRELISACKK